MMRREKKNKPNVKYISQNGLFTVPLFFVSLSKGNSQQLDRKKKTHNSFPSTRKAGFLKNGTGTLFAYVNK